MDLEAKARDASITSGAVSVLIHGDKTSPFVTALVIDAWLVVPTEAGGLL